MYIINRRLALAMVVNDIPFHLNVIRYRMKINLKMLIQ